MGFQPFLEIVFLLNLILWFEHDFKYGRYAFPPHIHSLFVLLGVDCCFYVFILIHLIHHFSLH